MAFASYIRIENCALKDVYLWPIDEELQKHWGLLIAAGHYIILDFALQKYQLDIDACFFQFKGMKRKIKPKNIAKYKVEVQCL